ncbi:HdeA [Paraburkholderia sp. UYCP14C]|uniref:HdeA/HdeB family chaperone n=1 Tax=Paraburkholderia sp. UYCP14C TaxID=2511130 RepID=UPI00101EAD9D|nr:HdeA/HdeB family chaperone [Paraburkholderia sp. UYCP14C]RZF27923.1 HdeA [Paraburkholderia sp. UYCP14C]
MHRSAICALLLGSALAVTAFAQAPTKANPMKMKCEDFLAVGEVYRPALVYWVAGVDKVGITETDTMVEDTATPVAAVVAECQKDPKASFHEKVRKMYKSGQIKLFDHH